VTKFDPQHMERLLSPERYQWHDPDMILDALALAAGMIFADVGAGPGFFTLPAAKRVGPAGKVYALDVEPRMLERLRERASAEGIVNIEGLLSEEERLPLPDVTVDAVLVANVLHEVSEQVSFLRETARVMRPGSMLAVVEWRKRKMEKGPPVAERLSYQEVARALGAGSQTGEQGDELKRCVASEGRQMAGRKYGRPSRRAVSAAVTSTGASAIQARPSSARGTRTRGMAQCSRLSVRTCWLGTCWSETPRGAALSPA